MLTGIQRVPGTEHRHSGSRALMMIKKSQKYTLEKKTTSSTKGAGQTGCLHVEERATLIALCKTQLHMDQRPQHKSRCAEAVISSPSCAHKGEQGNARSLRDRKSTESSASRDSRKRSFHCHTQRGLFSHFGTQKTFPLGQEEQIPPINRFLSLILWCTFLDDNTFSIYKTCKFYFILFFETISYSADWSQTAYVARHDLNF